MLTRTHQQLHLPIESHTHEPAQKINVFLYVKIGKGLVEVDTVQLMVKLVLCLQFSIGSKIM
jgi:hypothetical protein